MGFSIGVLVGSLVGHGLLQWWGVSKLGYRILPQFLIKDEIRSAMKSYVWLTIPLLVGVSFSLNTVDEIVIKAFASSMEEGAVSWLSYSRRLMMLPVGVLAQAAGIEGTAIRACPHRAPRHLARAVPPGV